MKMKRFPITLESIDRWTENPMLYLNKQLKEDKIERGEDEQTPICIQMGHLRSP